MSERGLGGFKGFTRPARISYHVGAISLLDILSGIHYTDQSALRLGMNKQITYLDDCFIATPAQGPLVLDIKQEISRGLKTELQSEIDGFPLSPQRRVGGFGGE